MLAFLSRTPTPLTFILLALLAIVGGFVHSRMQRTEGLDLPDWEDLDLGWLLGDDDDDDGPMPPPAPAAGDLA